MGDDGFRRTRFWALGEEMTSLRPAGPFTVDGITYGWDPYESPSVCVRPMVQLLPDDEPYDDDEDRCTMFCSDPPTEQELDLYVKERILPAT